MELRALNCEFRTTGRTIVGHGAVFNSLSLPIGGNFREKIRRGAFARSLQSGDVRALFNHDPNLVLGRSKAGVGTLHLEEDSHGLAFSLEAPSTTTGNDVLESIRRRDITGCSIGFQTREDVWSEHHTIRELLDVELLDVSLVTYPAYPQTDCAIRSDDGQSRIIQVGWYEAKRIAMPMPGWGRSQILNKERENILASESEVERLRLRLELAKRL
jgi:uncharacterized protein